MVSYYRHLMKVVYLCLLLFNVSRLEKKLLKTAVIYKDKLVCMFAKQQINFQNQKCISS